jgi:hypothetical protein
MMPARVWVGPDAQRRRKTSFSCSNNRIRRCDSRSWPDSLAHVPGLASRTTKALRSAKASLPHSAFSFVLPGQRVGGGEGDFLEPEPLGVSEVFDHPQRRPAGWQHRRAQLAFVEARDDVECSGALGVEESVSTDASSSVIVPTQGWHECRCYSWRPRLSRICAH